MEATVRHIFPAEKKSKTHLWVIATALISIFIFTKCDDALRAEARARAKLPKSDTIKTVCLYRMPLDGRLMLDYAIRVTADTLKLVDGKAKNMRDSFYWTPIVDSVRKDGKAQFDSLGKPMLTVTWQPHPQSLIVKDFQANIPLK